MISLLQFCEQRLDTTAMASFRATGRGLTDLDTISAELAKGNYRPALIALWSEQDVHKKAAWLRGREEELHAPLLFEQALAEFERNPTLETIQKISMPLILSACFRTAQDWRCYAASEEEHVQPDQDIANLYTQILQALIPSSLTVDRERMIADSEAIDAKVRQVAEKSLDTRCVLPRPNWILQGFVTEGDETEIRHNFARDFLEQG